MKKKNFNKKLLLKKEVVTNLMNPQMKSVKGGTNVSRALGVQCFPGGGGEITSQCDSNGVNACFKGTI